MNTLGIVFGTIKERCKETGVSDEACFSELEELVKDRHVFLSLYLYLEVLERLGLIIFSNRTKEIILTEKGKGIDDDPIVNVRIAALLFLYFLRRVFLFILFGLMFILLWPMFIFILPYYSGKKK